MSDRTHAALIGSLAENLRPVRRLPAPWARSALFLLVAAAAAAALMAVHGTATIAGKLGDGRYELAAFAGAIATGVTSAFAAFVLSVPGRSPLWAILPLPFLCLWVAASGVGCMTEQGAAADMAMPAPQSCFKFIVLFSLPLSLLLFLMLRRAFSVRPALTATMAGLAAASVAAVLLDLMHPVHATAADLAWHAAAILVVIGANRLLSARALGPALVVFMLSHGAVAAEQRPVVVELFTSQGCSSCPPADALLNEFARSRRDLLPLAFHVEYWNRLGWTDPYSSPEATERQRVYVARLTDPTLFTPEMIIDGTRAVIGSDRGSIEQAIGNAQDDALTAANVSLKATAGEVVVSVGAGTGKADIVLIGYDRSHTTPIGRGENGGRTVTEANIVRSVQSIGAWTGAAVSLRRPRPAGQLLAVLLAAPDGRIVGVDAPGR